MAVAHQASAAIIADLVGVQAHAPIAQHLSHPSERATELQAVAHPIHDRPVGSVLGEASTEGRDA